MKRKIIAGILIMTTLALTACGGQEGSTNTGNNTGVDSQVQTESQAQEDSQENQAGDKTESKTEEISMEALRNHAVTPSSEFEYYSTSEGWEITGYLGNDEIVVLPEEHEGKKIVGITNSVFGEDSGVKAVKISDSVERIAASFMNNKELQYVICGSSLKEIGVNAFSLCSSLEVVELNDGLEKISGATFTSCKKLAYIEIPESVTKIELGAFYNTSSEFVVRAQAGSVAEQIATIGGHLFEAVE